MIRTHRIGSYTFGAILIISGVLLLLHTFLPDIPYEYILRFWPVALILLGLEILIANVRSSKVQFVYDIPAIIMIFVVIGFIFCVAIADFSLEYYKVQQFI